MLRSRSCPRFAAREASSRRGSTHGSSSRRRAVALDDDARPTLVRFVELRTPAPEQLSVEEGKAIVRELKAVGGDLRSLRLALTGAERGPELAAVLAALSRDEALRRAT